MLAKLASVITWLNAVPGRKRGVAAALLGLAAALRALGHEHWAGAAETANLWVQTYLVPGADLAGGLMAIVGFLHAAVRRAAAADARVQKVEPVEPWSAPPPRSDPREDPGRQ